MFIVGPEGLTFNYKYFFDVVATCGLDIILSVKAMCAVTHTKSVSTSSFAKERKRSTERKRASKVSNSFTYSGDYEHKYKRPKQKKATKL